MRRSSLSLRLLIAAAVSICVAVAFTWFVVSNLFEQFAEQRAVAALSSELDRLTGLITYDETGEVGIEDVQDPAYLEPLGGSYWQIQTDTELLSFSRSLWDGQLEISVPQNAGQKTVFWSTFADRPVLVVGWKLDIDPEVFPDGILLSVATDVTELQQAIAGFQLKVMLWMVLLTSALLLAAWFQVGVGLQPLEAVRSEVRRLKLSHHSRLPTDFPKEVVPLVDEVNELLESRERSMIDARNRAADLAHGLKTPLTIIDALAEDARRAGETELADHLTEQVRSMGAFVERELVRAKQRPIRNARTEVGPVVRTMVNSVGKLPTKNVIEWRIEVEDGILMPMGKYDLMELLGNLLDNARKHARSSLLVSAKQGETSAFLSVEDDGAGAPDHMLEKILQRGQQGRDEESGYGLGLAIVRDLASSHGLGFTLRNNNGRGFRAELSWSVAKDS